MEEQQEKPSLNLLKKVYEKIENARFECETIIRESEQVITTMQGMINKYDEKLEKLSELMEEVKNESTTT